MMINPRLIFKHKELLFLLILIYFLVSMHVIAYKTVCMVRLFSSAIHELRLPPGEILFPTKF